MSEDFKKILEAHSEEVAPRLLGCELIRELNGKIIKVKIVETESYHQTDSASHSFRGITPRTKVMFGEAGHLYVYFTYGMHYCCNIVTGKIGEGSAVLIRAVEPIEGEEIMKENRIGFSGKNLSNGPAKLCKALKIDNNLNGHYLKKAPLQLNIKAPLKSRDIIATNRIGISTAKDKNWRFYIRGNDYVSHK